MILTKKEAVKLHRQLWNRIADKTLEEKRWVEKVEVIQEITNKYIAYNCFCCDYDSQLGNECDYCPIVWPCEGDLHRCSSSIYLKWSSSTNYKEVAQLARLIAELPERPDLPEDILE